MGPLHADNFFVIFASGCKSNQFFLFVQYHFVFMLNLQGISTLIFDFGGVLINLDRERCVKKFIEYGVTDAGDMLDNYHQSGVFMHLENGDISLDDFHDTIRRITGKNISDTHIDDAFKSFLLEVPDEKLDLLLRLRKNYRVLLLSNTNAIHFPWCEQTVFTYKGHTLADFFDKCYLSYKMNLSKPDAAIFKALLADEHLTAQECLFLDDGEANIKAAQSLGFQTYLVHANEALSPLFENI